MRTSHALLGQQLQWQTCGRGAPGQPPRSCVRSRGCVAFWPWWVARPRLLVRRGGGVLSERAQGLRARRTRIAPRSPGSGGITNCHRGYAPAAPDALARSLRWSEFGAVMASGQAQHPFSPSPGPTSPAHVSSNGKSAPLAPQRAVTRLLRISPLRRRAGGRARTADVAQSPPSATVGGHVWAPPPRPGLRVCCLCAEPTRPPRRRGAGGADAAVLAERGVMLEDGAAEGSRLGCAPRGGTPDRTAMIDEIGRGRRPARRAM